MINTIILGHALNVLPQLPAESVSCVTTSPPYWGLRDYGIEPVIWDGDKDCKHDFITKERRLHSGSTKSKIPELSGQETDWVTKNGFCLKCNAWRGSLGLEPTFELYIKHLCDIFDEVKRVLRKDGTCWVNIGDSYFGSGQDSGKYGEFSQEIGKREIGIAPRYNLPTQNKANKISKKSLCDIPYRFSIEMTNRGWIKRNTIIWHKPNCMPSSADDRFTVDFEYLFFFTKNNKAIFWTNEKTLECVDKKPPGTKGIEGRDWEWRPCPRCQGVGGETKIDEEIAETMGSPRARYHRITKQENCKRCKGLGKVKVSLWTGHDYWFEQQFEEVKEETKRDKRTINGYKNIRGRNWDKDPNSLFTPMGSMKVNPQGRNKRCVWIIPTQPFPEAHFAVYPEGLIETPIKAGCPEFVCKKCGKARVKIYEYIYKGTTRSGYNDGHGQGKHLMIDAETKHGKLLGLSDCGCNAGWESGIVLDPFIGSGTTAREALKQRKRFIGIDIKQEYVDMSYRKIAKVQQEFSI